MEQRETSPSAPQASENCYPTIKDSVEDLKNPDKDRRRTPDTFLMTFSFFLQRFCQGIAELLSTGELYSGQPYQRPVLDRVVDKLVREWDPRLLTPLVVS